MSDSGKMFNLYISHAFINCLFAGYQGKYSVLNILNQLDHNEFDGEDIEAVRETLDKVNLWGSNLWNSEALLKNEVSLPLSNDARAAVSLLSELKNDLEEQIRLTEEALDSDLEDDPDAVKILIAAFARYAYAKDNYIKGLIQYGKIFDLPEVVDKWMEHMPYCVNDIKTANFYFYTFRDSNGELDDQFYEDLRSYASELPSIFNEQVNDINEIFEIYFGSLGEEQMMH